MGTILGLVCCGAAVVLVSFTCITPAVLFVLVSAVFSGHRNALYIPLSSFWAFCLYVARVYLCNVNVVSVSVCPLPWGHQGRRGKVIFFCYLIDNKSIESYGYGKLILSTHVLVNATEKSPGIRTETVLQDCLLKGRRDVEEEVVSWHRNCYCMSAGVW